MRKLFLSILLLVSLNTVCQTKNKDTSSFEIKQELLGKNFVWPPKSVLIRIFKLNKILEVWVSNDSTNFELFKSYTICTISGKLGPKRKEGDFQVPEGFYYINQFNYFSNYWLSLGINYPNKSDKILSNERNLGGSIYIHGGCALAGCISIGNENIEELFSLTKNVGSKVQVHIFPINYYESTTQWNKLKSKNDEFELNLFEGYSIFERTKKIPLIFVDKEGKYFFIPL